MGKVLKIYLGQITSLLNVSIFEKEGIEKYDIKELLDYIISNNVECKERFVACYNSQRGMELLHSVSSVFNGYFSFILLNYKNLLPPELVEDLTDNCNIQYRSLELYKEPENKSLDYYWGYLGRILLLSSGLKKYIK
jgi:hypothetical protein